MKIRIDTSGRTGVRYADPTVYQNSTLRYTPRADFPAYLASVLGRARIMRAWITLDEFWDYRTGVYSPDYAIGVKHYPDSELHYIYDWKKIVPSPSGTRFRAYLTSHAGEADEVMLNVRRLEREVSDGVITYGQYEDVVFRAVEYCKSLAPNIRYIECCNEIELAGFGKLTPDEYVKIYLSTRRAVMRLNEKHAYPIPLELGGYGVAQPLLDFETWSEIMRQLKAELGEQPMDFYSFHTYDLGCRNRLRRDGHDDIADGIGQVGRLKLAMTKHRKLLAELGLADVPLFWDELGTCRTTGVPEDSLANAAGNVVYLIASSDSAFDNSYFFPWCTFHNPELQISFTQFTENPDGSYSATPNGMAVLMLHSLTGERLAAAVTDAAGHDSEYRAVAAAEYGNDGAPRHIGLVAVNQTPENDRCITDIALPDGGYTVTEYICDSKRNNNVTSDGNGRLTATGVSEFSVSGGSLVLKTNLEPNAFVMYFIEKK